jgi:hypothetical protein
VTRSSLSIRNKLTYLVRDFTGVCTKCYRVIVLCDPVWSVLAWSTARTLLLLRFILYKCLITHVIDQQGRHSVFIWNISGYNKYLTTSRKFFTMHCYKVCIRSHTFVSVISKQLRQSREENITYICPELGWPLNSCFINALVFANLHLQCCGRLTAS